MPILKNSHLRKAYKTNISPLTMPILRNSHLHKAYKNYLIAICYANTEEQPLA